MWVGFRSFFFFEARTSHLEISKSFLVIIPRGSHPFPSRTRKLSLAGPMILHGQLCGNVGRRRDYLKKRLPSANRFGAFFISGSVACTPPIFAWSQALQARRNSPIQILLSP